MTTKIRIGVIYGGRSGEHEVSVRSARSVIEAIDTEKYEVIPVAITREGRWLSPAESASLLPESARAKLPDYSGDGIGGGSALVVDTSRGGHLRQEGAAAGERRLDVVFPVIHGTYGEDGTIQGLLEMAGIPYVGCGVLASSTGMDKVTMKTLFRHAGLPVCKYDWFLRRDWEANPSEVRERVERGIGYPCFVKPANLGSSVAVTKAHDVEELASAVKLALAYDEWVVLEEAVAAREIECGLLGYGRLRASLPGEVRPSHEFYDYDDKYTDGGAELLVPAPLPREVVEEVQGMALAAGHALRVDGMARVDFFYEENGRGLLVNEVNTIPGFTPISMYPKMWDATGIGYSDLIEHLVDAALERHHSRADRIGRTGRSG